MFRKFLLVGFIFVLFSCNTVIYDSGIFDRDFLFDNFDFFDSEVWYKINNVFKYSSRLNDDNVSVSNGNLVINIPYGVLEGGGVKSLKNFRNGRFSMLVLNRNTNVAVEMELFNNTWNITISFRYFFSGIENTNVVEVEVLSPRVSFKYAISNQFQSNSVLMTVEVVRDTTSMYFNNRIVTNIKFDNDIDKTSVSISGYLIYNDLYILDRNLFIDYFSYERN